jgi:hypothetical protein
MVNTQGKEDCAGYLGHLFSHLTFCTSLNEPSCQSPRQERTITTLQLALTVCCCASVEQGEIQLAFRLVIPIQQRVCLSLHALHQRVLWWIRPSTPSLVLGTRAAMTRAKAQLIAQNALLRVPLMSLHRQIK